MSSFKIWVKTPKVDVEDLWEMEVEPTMTILQLKQKMIQVLDECKTHQPDEVKPILPDRPEEELIDTKTLEDYGIKEGHKLYTIMMKTFVIGPDHENVEIRF